MKVSKYNTFFPYQSKVIGFNGISREYIVLEKELYELYITSVEDDIENINNVHPDLYKYLVSNSFIVDNNLNEFDEFKKMIRKIDFDDTIFELHLNPTMDCNFKCWYCYETHIKESCYDTEMLRRVKLCIANIINRNPQLERFSINWFGGEPLMAYDYAIIPILEHTIKLCKLRGVDFCTLFTTNGFLLDKEKLKQLKKYNVAEFQITLDGHRERHDKVRFLADKSGSYDKIVENIKLASNFSFHVSVRINYTRETFKDIEKIIDDFADITEESRKNLLFDFHQVWQDNTDLKEEKKSIINKFKQSGLQVVKPVIYSFDHTCYADKKNNANINYNGDVFKCTSRDFSTNNREGVLNKDGFIEWNQKYYERLNSKFKNKACLKCPILPICRGGCSQQALERQGQNTCIYNYTKQKKENLIKDYFTSIFDDV